MQKSQQRPALGEKTARDIFFVVFRQKQKILLFFLAVFFTVAIGTLLTPKVYQSDTKLMVLVGRESVSLDPTATTGRTISVPSQDRESEINSELEILSSRELLEKVVAAIGTEAILYGAEEKTSTAQGSLTARLRGAVKGIVRLPFAWLAGILPGRSASDPLASIKQNESAVALLRKNLHIEATKKSNIITISYEALSPALAQKLLGKLTEFYLDAHIKAHRTTGSYDFFDQQTEELREKLAATERQLRDMKNQTGTASIEEQRKILLQRTGDLQRDLEATDSAAAASAAKIETLRKVLAGTPRRLTTEEVTDTASSAVDELRKRINDLKLQEQELLSTYTETSVPVTEIRRRIGEARALLRNAQQTRQVTQGVNVTYQQIEADLLKEQGDLSSFKARSATLKKQLAGSRLELTKMNEAEVQMAQLQRDLATLQSNYNKYLESQEQARIDQALEMGKISNISIVQPASYAINPIRPKTIPNLALGVFLGLFGGLGLAFLSEYLDHSLKTPQEVEEKLGLPVLASLPVLKLGATRFDNGSPGLTLSAQYPPAGFPLNHGAGGLQIHHEYREGPAKDRLFDSDRQPGATRVVGVTSCRRGEGVSTVAAQLAVTLAHRNSGRVLLIDTDFGSAAGIPQLFGIDVTSGLSDIIAGGNINTAFIRPSTFERLDILAAGQTYCNLSRLSESQQFKTLLAVLLREYHSVVIDTPPLEEEGTLTTLTSVAAGVIMVIEAEGVRWQVAGRAVERLRQTESNILGVVLNKRRYYIPDWLYRRL